MPIQEASCFLCGAPIDDFAHGPGWMREFRALYTILEEWEAARVSGVGERRQFEDIIPLDQSVNVDVSESIVDDSWVQIGLFRLSFGGKYPPDPPIIPIPLWGFPLHDKCWELLCAVDKRFQNQSTLQALFDLCRSQPIQNGVLNWGHNYHGLVGYNADVKKLFPGEEARLQGRDLPNDNTHQYDPMEIPRLDYLASLGTSTTSQNATWEPKLVASSHSDPLGRLPPEILVDVLVRLNSIDAANFRLASRAIANIGLPDAFWCSRFWPGREFEHIFELAASQAANGQWRTVFKQARALKRLPVMVNRQRVWALACQLRDLVTLRLESPFCHGSLFKSFFNPDAPRDDRVWHTAQTSVCPATTAFAEGTRSLYDAAITLTGITSKAWASLVTINGKCYVSGLRLTQSNGENIQLGYHHPRHEIAFTWDESENQPHSFVGFKVAMDTRGIRGLCALSAQGAPSNWVGDRQGVPKKSITCIDSTTGTIEAIHAVKGGFDMVAISIRGVGRENEMKAGQKNEAHLGESALWYPELPDPGLKLSGVRDSRLPRYLDDIPYSMCLFGGGDGQLLPYLTGITVWIVDRSALGIHADHTHIWAIEFHYRSPADDIESTILGRVPDPDPDNGERQRYDIPLDSRNGERICRVDAMYEDPRFPFALILDFSRRWFGVHLVNQQ
ncbi:hypothetical protein FALBO_6085 [Fusarium albosuccineum]|uniref:F-box domain-containing protein n=1 Tax=Fusarium albosuccineum TaxID=1237068 RepID=A0A8H4LCC8_9HYPO|nr:hypothetical protein FALBO_6085 [Fusarium albosuccineum]